jgi:hypothetical protein
MDAVDFNGVAALLHGLSPSPEWPNDIRARLRSRAIQLAMWELRHQQVLSQALDALAGASVQPLLFKGTALAYSLYENPALRTRGDTDLLIPINAKARVHDTLASLGFDRAIGVSGELASYQASYTARSEDGTSHTLDVHWQINNSELLAQLFTFDELNRDAQPLPRLSPMARSVSRPQALLLACMHRATHKQNPIYVDGRPHHDANRLIWLFDIHLLCATLTAAERQAFVSLAGQKRLRGVCCEGLHEADVRFGPSTRAALISALTPIETPEPSAKYLNGGKLRQHAMDFRALGNSRRRARYLSEVLFPSRIYMRSKFNSPAGWLPWLYVRRAAGAVARMSKEAGWQAVPRAGRKFVELDPNGRRVFVEALLLMPVFSIGLRLLGLRRLIALLARSTGSQRPWTGNLDVHRFAALVAAACRRSPASGTCLTRSLLLQWLLRRRGVETDLRLGVRRTAQGIEAHAWVESQGRPVNDSADIVRHFAPFEGQLPIGIFSS